MNPEEPRADHVRGERAENSITRSLSLQSRLGNILAVLLMCGLGLGALTGYYASIMARSRAVPPGAIQRGALQSGAVFASKAGTQSESSLPSLGRIDAPAPAPFEPVPGPVVGRAMETLTEVPLAPNASVTTGGTPASKTPAELAIERRLSGTVFAATAPGNTTVPDAVAANAGEIGALLHPTTTPAASAHSLPAQRLLLPKGAFIDCTLETAIDSTLPGMTTCVMATDAFGVDGNVVLLERGTKLIGETRGQVQRGAARLFVLWTEARTPTGVIVPLDSPGTDELGRAGLTGEVRNHFWERFGAAMLVSVIDGALQAAAQSSHGGGGSVVINPSGSQDILTEILKNTVNIAPTVIKRNGDRIQVLVARDLDFRSVYELRSTSLRR